MSKTCQTHKDTHYCELLHGGWPWALHPVFAWELLQEEEGGKGGTTAAKSHLIHRSWLQYPPQPCVTLKGIYSPGPHKYKTKLPSLPVAPSLRTAAWHLLHSLMLACWIKITLCECVCSRAFSIPISGVNPRSLPGVVVDKKHSAIVIPGFLPARGQRQLRALSPLTAADPRHSVGMVRGLKPSALLFIPPEKKVALHCITTNSTSTHLSARRKDAQIHTFPPGFVRWKRPAGGTSTFRLPTPQKTPPRRSHGPRSSMFASSTIFHSSVSIFG